MYNISKTGLNIDCGSSHVRMHYFPRCLDSEGCRQLVKAYRCPPCTLKTKLRVYHRFFQVHLKEPLRITMLTQVSCYFLAWNIQNNITHVFKDTDTSVLKLLGSSSGLSLNSSEKEEHKCISDTVQSNMSVLIN